MSAVKMAVLSILLASCLLMAVRRTSGKNIFGSGAFGNSDLCSGLCFIDIRYNSNCTDPCTCISSSVNEGNNTGWGTCHDVNSGR
uniref:Putative secreted protein n=1 Tax=Amblyomma triste TaxID=251400 RepID=A0A023G6J7_AMBTT